MIKGVWRKGVGGKTVFDGALCTYDPDSGQLRASEHCAFSIQTWGERVAGVAGGVCVCVGGVGGGGCRAQPGLSTFWKPGADR